jgi:hypothetical protein
MSKTIGKTSRWAALLAAVAVAVVLLTGCMTLTINPVT